MEKYEVEYRRTVPAASSSCATSTVDHTLCQGSSAAERERERRRAELERRNPAKFGWRKLRTLHWYEWNIVDPEDSAKEFTRLRAKLENLSPATSVEFRVRAVNHFGTSRWSFLSGPLATSAAVPDSPTPPFASHAVGDALW